MPRLTDTNCKYPETRIRQMSNAYYFRLSTKVKPKPEWLDKRFAFSIYIDPLTFRYDEVKDLSNPEDLIKIVTTHYGKNMSYYLKIPKRSYDAVSRLINPYTKYKVDWILTKEDTLHFKFRIITKETNQNYATTLKKDILCITEEYLESLDEQTATQLFSLLEEIRRAKNLGWV